jgi:hypothetical protein
MEKHFFSDKIIDNFNPFQADNKVLFEMSMKFANGDEVETNFVAAHVCLNIAAMRGCKESAELRRELAYDMSTEEIAQAQKEARALLSLIKKQNEN